MDADNAPPVYAPTPTGTFSFCHLKWELQHRERWVPRRWGKRELSKLLGRAFAEGLASLRHLQASKTGPYVQTVPTLELVQKVALSSWMCDLAELITAGVEVEPNDRDETVADLLSGLGKVLADDPLSEAKGWKVQDVELSLPDHGHARIDWGGLDPHGVLCQVDYKVRMKLEQWRYDKEVERYRYSPQMLHYNWAYSAYKQLPCHRYYICLIVLHPRFSVQCHQYEIDPELQQAWLASARQKWADMQQQAAGARVPDMAYVHRDAYGDCPYQRACLAFRLDPSLMRTAYVQVPPRTVP